MRRGRVISGLSYGCESASRVCVGGEKVLIVLGGCRTIPMIVYDVSLSLLLTACFLYPIRR